MTIQPGFTRAPDVRAILDRYDGGGEEPRRAGGLMWFQGLTVPDMRALALLVPLDEAGEDEETRWSGVIADLFPHATLFGYRVSASRDDERITLTGCVIAWNALDRDGLYVLVQLAPEGMDHRPDGQLHVWWDEATLAPTRCHAQESA